MMLLPSVLVTSQPLGCGETTLPAWEVASAKVPRGKLFEPIEEVALHPVLRQLAMRLPGASRGVLMVPEFVGPYGVADLLVVTYVGDKLANRLALGIDPLLSELDAALVVVAHPLKPRTISELAAAVGRTERAIRRRVSGLVSRGALVETTAGYMKPSALRPVGRLWALEAKVSDWRRGVGQANRYGVWADGSALVLSRVTNEADVISSASRLGLGVAHGPRWLIRPTLRPQNDATRLWASEHLIAALALA